MDSEERSMDVVAYGSLDPWTLHDRLVLSSTEAVLDLRRASFFTPGAIVGLATIAQHNIQAGRPVRLIRPDNDNVANYLSRVRLGRVMDELGVTHDLTPVREHHLGDSLLELTRFADARDIERLLQVVWRTASDTHPQLAEGLFRSLGEAANNVTQHARTPHGFMVAQAVPGNGRLFFAVGDAGVGFLPTLERFGISDDLAAIQLATQGGYSAVTDDPARGYGLRTATDALVRLGGSMHVLSGQAMRYEAASATRHARSPTSLPGALVQGILPLTRRLY
jgi:hypothetical protein